MGYRLLGIINIDIIVIINIDVILIIIDAVFKTLLIPILVSELRQRIRRLSNECKMSPVVG